MEMADSDGLCVHLRFYAGQLYTTIGYGLPAAHTNGGRLASIAYIMLGIPIFLLILADVGKHLSRGLRKLYKRMRTAHKKLPEAATRRMSEPVKVGVGDGVVEGKVRRHKL